MIASMISAVTLGGGGSSVPDVSFIRIFLALAVGIGLVVLIAWWLRRGGSLGSNWLTNIGPACSSARISLLEHKRVRPGVEVALLRCDDVDSFVLLSPTGAVVLHTERAPEATSRNQEE